MRVELFRAEAPDEIVAVLTWNDGNPRVESGADVPGVTELLRPTSVQIDDPALRHLGTSGESVLTPGSLAWFRAAIATRAAGLGFAVRFVTAQVRGGWDPASNYRRFESQVQRLQR